MATSIAPSVLMREDVQMLRTMIAVLEQRAKKGG